ncbi:MAG: DUF1553 domain-containing protein [Verrucomicrobiales bacterium]
MSLKRLCHLPILAALLSLATGALPALAASIDFARDIRPILSDNCFACHGPDEAQRKAGLRLDLKSAAFLELKSGGHAIVAGNPAKSLLLERVASHDPDEVMPPAKSGKKLSETQIQTLKQWINDGAAWKEHWAYIPPERPELPKVKNTSWPKNEIDYFVLQQLEKQGLKPSPEANKEALARKVSLDLTGLPPSVEELDAFLADKNENAYESMVDRLLASPHYGERMTMNWLDLARFADTSGYHFDSPRYMWLWRDWVIKAFNKNMPFDQFTIEQLAGDLLPNATLEQKIASGFHRNVMSNDEGGADADEYLNKYVADRVNTTGVVWLGSTLGCAECHDHKYDPITQKEYYQMYAFFHNITEKGLDGTRTENPLPRISVPSPEQAVEMIDLDKAVAAAEQEMRARESELPAAQKTWEESLLTNKPKEPSAEGLLAHFTFDDTADGKSPQGSLFIGTTKGDGAIQYLAGRHGKALLLNGKNQHIEVSKEIVLERTNSFSYGSWINFKGTGGTVFSRMKDDQDFRGFDLLVSDAIMEVHIVSKWPDNAVKVRTKQSFPRDTWLHVMATYDGSSKASGVKIYVNGREQPLDITHDKLTDTIVADQPLLIGKRSSSGPYNGLIDDLRIYNRALTQAEVSDMMLAGFAHLAALPLDKRSPPESSEISKFFKEGFADAYKAAEQKLAKARGDKNNLLGRIPNTMVMQEMEKPRDTFILIRGSFLSKGEKVSANTPGYLPPLPEGSPTNRLGLAQWLMAKNHPLTSRVTVNRYWQLFFGTGLTKTVNDFGSQVEWPSHPELLEWLASQFRDGGGSAKAAPWDLKALVRLMVTSSAYRQSTVVTPRLLERDPYNRLLTRGPRFRLEAEFIRDNALAISGLLNKKIGGESVRPYQPPGLWDVTDTRFDQSHGEDLYRRGMYVYWKRAVHYPSFATFDAPNRETCTAQRPRTSTPLQSLVLMNDPVYVEAARNFAARILKEGGADHEDRIIYAFKTALARRPTPQEISIMSQTLEDMLSTYNEDTGSAQALLKVGESPAPAEAKEPELAAYTALANVILNLNEVISR